MADPAQNPIWSTGTDWSSRRAPPRIDGEHIGKYELCYELGTGGMATVFLATATGPHGFRKLVALKRIKPSLVSEHQFVEMFLDEARIAARLDHMNVCSVFDFGHADGSYYIAMEYLLGESMRSIGQRLVKRGPAKRQDIAVLAKIICDVAEGLHSAHSATDELGKPMQIVHRDVSPQNIIIGYDGGPRVLDFGIARAVDRIHATRTGDVKGKVGYMAPEQLKGHPIDHRVDIWSLGVMFWEFLTFQRLFRKKNDAETLYAILDSEIRPPSQLNRNIPPELDAIVMKMLARDVADRYVTCREIARDLTRVIARFEPMGTGDVAEWMHDLFPGGYDKLKRLALGVQQTAFETAPTHLEGPEHSRTAASNPRGLAARPAERKRPPSPTFPPSPRSPIDAVPPVSGNYPLGQRDSMAGVVPSDDFDAPPTAPYAPRASLPAMAPLLPANLQPTPSGASSFPPPPPQTVEPSNKSNWLILALIVIVGVGLVVGVIAGGWAMGWLGRHPSDPDITTGELPIGGEESPAEPEPERAEPPSGGFMATPVP